MIKQKFSRGTDCEDFNPDSAGACVRSRECATWRGKMREVGLNLCSGVYDPDYATAHAEELAEPEKTPKEILTQIVADIVKTIPPVPPDYEAIRAIVVSVMAEAQEPG